MNRGRSPTGILLLALAGIVAAGDTPAERRSGPAWKTFRSSAGGFRMVVPGAPKRTLTRHVSFIGTITDHIFVATDGEQVFTLDYSDLPGFAVDFAGADTIYDHAKGALLSQTCSRTVSFQDFTQNGMSGKDLVYETPPTPGKPKRYGQARFFLVGHRLYVIDAAVPAGDSEALARRFLDGVSFD